MKNHEIMYQGTKIKAKDILEFLNIFHLNSDKSDKYNQRITNPDGSYSIVYKEQVGEFKSDKSGYVVYELEKKVNYDTDNKIITTETTNGNETIITDSNDMFITKQIKSQGKVISETKANGLTYIYEEDKTVVKKDNKEIVTIPQDKELINILEGKSEQLFITLKDKNTGVISKNTIYTDAYRVVSFSQSCYISLESVKSVIAEGINDCSYPTILENGYAIINSLSKEEDTEFKNKYILGMLNKTIELAKIISVDTSALEQYKKTIEQCGINSISMEQFKEAYFAVIDKMKEKHPEAMMSKIDNKYYHSDKTYTKITTNTSIVIIDNKTKKTTNIDLNKILSPFSGEEKATIADALKSMQAEALLDLATEVTFDNEYVGDGAGGSFSPLKDRLSLHGGSCSLETILHELGHAVDDVRKGYGRSQTMTNPKFQRVFREEMRAFLKAGNKRCEAYYDSKDVYHTAHDTLKGAETDNDSTTVRDKFMLSKID